MLSETGRRKERFLPSGTSGPTSECENIPQVLLLVLWLCASELQNNSRFVAHQGVSDTFPVNKHDCKNSDQAGYDFAAFNSRNVDTVLTGYVWCEN